MNSDEFLKLEKLGEIESMKRRKQEKRRKKRERGANTPRFWQKTSLGTASPVRRIDPKTYEEENE